MLRREQRQNIKDIREGQREACEAVVCQHYESIYRFMVYLSGDVNLAEDLTQETFASAWANIGNYKGRASSGTWLHRIAYHKFIDSTRKLKRHAAMMAGLKQDSCDAPQSPNPLSQVMANERSLFLYETMHRLESFDYIMIVLHYIQGLSFREMAKVLDKPVGTVKWQTSRALKKLKMFLSGRI